MTASKTTSNLASRQQEFYPQHVVWSLKGLHITFERSGTTTRRRPSTIGTKVINLIYVLSDMRDERCACVSLHTSGLLVHTPHWSSTCPWQLQVPEASPFPSHTPQRSTVLPLFATPSHPAQLEPSPPHTPHASATSPPQLHSPAGMPAPPQTCLRV